jgi:nicotinate-nucleotide pyrophosphorylase (carboxylating)
MAVFFDDLMHNVEMALAEDIKTGDLTADLIPPHTQAYARIISRERAIICGRPWFDAVFHQLDSEIKIDWHCQEGAQVEPNQLLCELKGNARALLSGERSALNFLQTLSATATTTARYVAALGKGKTQLLDTRKTLPGLRLAQKYAVKIGGGQNHRIGLYDAILIKENHIIACGGLAQAVMRAKTRHPGISVEVETESLDEVNQALAAGADIIMLDNFSLEQIKQAVTLVNSRAKLEISGNIELANLSELADTGVDFISSGAITKHIQAIDLSMRFNFI